MDKEVLEAMSFCKNAHLGQLRKYTNEPYIVHPFSVAGLVMSVTDDQDMIIAAYMHDVVEDTGYTLNSIMTRFGFRVTKFVEGLTDISRQTDGNRKTRKEIDRLHLASSCPEVKTIKLADLIDNTKSIVAFDHSFAKVYMAEKKKLLPDLMKGDRRLWSIASDLINLYYFEQE